MLSAPIPLNEPERITSLRKMLLLSSPDEEAFDRVMAGRLALSRCSIVDPLRSNDVGS
jgi:hypothetical protein